MESHFSIWLRNARAHSGVSRAELEEVLEKRSGYVAQLENARIKPPERPSCDIIDLALGLEPGSAWEVAAPERLRAFDEDLADWHAEQVKKTAGSAKQWKRISQIAASRSFSEIPTTRNYGAARVDFHVALHAALMRCWTKDHAHGLGRIVWWSAVLLGERSNPEALESIAHVLRQMAPDDAGPKDLMISIWETSRGRAMPEQARDRMAMDEARKRLEQLVWTEREARQQISSIQGYAEMLAEDLLPLRLSLGRVLDAPPEELADALCDLEDGRTLTDHWHESPLNAFDWIDDVLATLREKPKDRAEVAGLVFQAAKLQAVLRFPSNEARWVAQALQAGRELKPTHPAVESMISYIQARVTKLTATS